MKKRKRKNHLSLDLSDAEFTLLKKKSKLAGLTQSDFLRMLICGAKIFERRTNDLDEVLLALSRIGNNLNQIAKFAHQYGAIDENNYARNAARVVEVIDEIKLKMEGEFGDGHDRALAGEGES